MDWDRALGLPLSNKVLGPWVPNSEAVSSQTRAFLITEWLWAWGLSAPVPGQLTLTSWAPWAETG